MLEIDAHDLEHASVFGGTDLVPLFLWIGLSIF